MDIQHIRAGNVSRLQIFKRRGPHADGMPEDIQCVSSASQDVAWPCVLLLTSLIWVVAISSSRANAQVETSLPTSQRVTINLSAGMPGQSQWLYIKDSDSTAYSTTSYNDSAWTPVGIPYSANLFTSFLNADSGGGDGDLNGTYNWYRLHFTLPAQFANSKILVEFEGAHTGAQVYINGTLLPGISGVAANAQASHVVGFIPFIADLTPYVTADGVTENVLAVSVSRNDTWFENPGFSEDYRFGQADAGLFRPAYMFITNKVHIPVNVYSNQKTWGTYVATVSEVPSSSSTQQNIFQVASTISKELRTIYIAANKELPPDQAPARSFSQFVSDPEPFFINDDSERLQRAQSLLQELDSISAALHCSWDPRSKMKCVHFKPVNVDLSGVIFVNYDFANVDFSKAQPMSEVEFYRTCRSGETMTGPKDSSLFCK